MHPHPTRNKVLLLHHTLQVLYPELNMILPRQLATWSKKSKHNAVLWVRLARSRYETLASPIQCDQNVRGIRCCLLRRSSSGTLSRWFPYANLPSLHSLAFHFQRSLDARFRILIIAARMVKNKLSKQLPNLRSTKFQTKSWFQGAIVTFKKINIAIQGTANATTHLRSANSRFLLLEKFFYYCGWSCCLIILHTYFCQKIVIGVL